MMRQQHELAVKFGDPALFKLIEEELALQDRALNLIAAANYISPAVQMAMDPRLSNIHSEGYPRRRYHEGQENADAIEELAIARAKALFGADHANVQPYRGTMANLAAAMAVMQPNETLIGLESRSGGHYTVGTDVHCIGRMFKVMSYSVDPVTGRLDYDAISRLAAETRPKVIFCGDTAYPRLWDYERLRAIADDVGAVLIADLSQTIGLVAGNAIPSPIPFIDIATAATYKTLRGPRGGLILSTRHYAKAVDRAVSPVCQGGPNIMMLAGIAAALEDAGSPAFREYCAQIVRNAQRFAEELRGRGFDLMTDGTENHACLINLRSRNVDGQQAAKRLAIASIICNGNQIPFDDGPPTRPSGLRLGVPAITTLGATERDMSTVATFIADVFECLANDEALRALGQRVQRFREDFHLTRSVAMGAEPPFVPKERPA